MIAACEMLCCVINDARFYCATGCTLHYITLHVKSQLVTDQDNSFNIQNKKINYWKRCNDAIFVICGCITSSWWLIYLRLFVSIMGSPHNSPWWHTLQWHTALHLQMQDTVQHFRRISVTSWNRTAAYRARTDRLGECRGQVVELWRTYAQASNTPATNWKATSTRKKSPMGTKGPVYFLRPQEGRYPFDKENNYNISTTSPLLCMIVMHPGILTMGWESCGVGESLPTPSYKFI